PAHWEDAGRPTSETSTDSEATANAATSVRSDVCGVDFHAHRLRDHLDGQDEPSPLAFAREPADHALERAMDDFHTITLADERRGIELHMALDERPDAVDFVRGPGYQLAAERDAAGDRRAPLDVQQVGRIEQRKAVAGKQGPVNRLP